MRLIDTHAHLYAEEFHDDLEGVLLRAEQAGLVAILTIAVDLETTYQNIALAQKYPFLYASCGVHPNSAHHWDESMENAFKVLVQHPSIKAVGETGLDYYRNYCPIPQQHRVLEKQMDLAYTTDLPLVIHCREAHQDLLKKCEEVSRQRGAFKGVIHCFSGTPEEAERYVDLGFYLSFAGPLTYKKSEALRAALRRTPLHRILVETDCPYLAPQSHRGKRNEPAYVKMTAERAAQELDLSFKDFGELVTQNAKELFRLPEEPV